MKYCRLYTLILLLLGSLLTQAQSFVHPGILHSQESLERISNLVRKKSMPSFGSYQILANTPESSEKYCIKGPFENIGRREEYEYTKDPCERDFNAAYYNALMWTFTKNEAHAAKAMEIIRAYATTLKAIHKPDDPLCAGLQGFILVNAAEIMRYNYAAPTYTEGWNEDDTEKVELMFCNVFQPILTTFYNTKPYSNGNWGIAVTKAQMAFGIFMNDRKLYTDAKDFFYKGKDNGSLPNYISETGQLQESGRDQDHCMFGIGSLTEIAEMAWNQGEDLYSALDNRIMKGYEYVSKSNLGFEVPFKTWTDLTGKYSKLHTLGQDGMGNFRPVFEIGYNHYVERKKLQMPYTKMILGYFRPEGPGGKCDNPGFGTLLFYLGEEQKQTEEGRIDEDFKTPTGWEYGKASFKAVKGIISLTSSGASIQKRRIMYNPDIYPYIVIKIPQMPKHIPENWLKISYSVMSAPEFWTFGKSNMKKIGDDIYVVEVANSLSNNGTLFSKKTVWVNVYINFRETDAEGVVLDWMRSYSTLDELENETL